MQLPKNKKIARYLVVGDVVASGETIISCSNQDSCKTIAGKGKVSLVLQKPDGSVRGAEWGINSTIIMK